MSPTSIPSEYDARLLVWSDQVLSHRDIGARLAEAGVAASQMLSAAGCARCGGGRRRSASSRRRWGQTSPSTWLAVSLKEGAPCGGRAG
jgi:hypothetical protein